MKAVYRLTMTLVLLHSFCSWAAEPIQPITRRLPPPGIEIPEKDRKELESQLKTIKSRVARAKDETLLPDIEVYIKAVDLALRHGEFYKENEIALAYEALKTANLRLDHLLAGRTPWTSDRGLVVRGYRSEIDGSAQPYGLEIPKNLKTTKGARLIVFLHGRGDKKTDLHFIRERETRQGKVATDDSIVLHPFGRHCMGFKSAGEIDVLDTVDHVQRHYGTDPRRSVLMGFSMGGAGAWHIGAHYPDRWAAMSPGAGFAETAQYNRLKKEDYPPSYEQTLWGMYDVPAYTRNLFNLPVVAYSGENDKQIQAARVMEQAFAIEGKKLTHVIGPGMAHAYHPQKLTEIVRAMKDASPGGHRADGLTPAKISIQTCTLRYGKVHWVRILQLEKHWQDSRVDAEIQTDDGDKKGLTVTTKNVKSLELSIFAYREMVIDGQPINIAKPVRGTTPFLTKTDGRWQWQLENFDPANSLVKSPGLQGPIDDAFMESFLVVTPSGQSKNERVQGWVEFELAHFQDRWRALYRGEVRTKRDVDVTPGDMEMNLVLWGDPDSNRIIKRLIDRLPITWNEKELKVRGERQDASTHVPLLIYPNPLNPRRYIVLNSGPTHREGHDRTNSLQNPKLPDWAVIDISSPPNELSSGAVVDADFFDEQWRIMPRR